MMIGFDRLETWSHVDIVPPIVLLEAGAEEVLSLGLVLLQHSTVGFTITVVQNLIIGFSYRKTTAPRCIFST